MDIKELHLEMKRIRELEKQALDRIIEATPPYLVDRYEITRSLIRNILRFGRINIIIGDRGDIEKENLENEIDYDIKDLKKAWEPLGIRFIRFGVLDNINSSIAIFEI